MEVIELAAKSHNQTNLKEIKMSAQNTPSYQTDYENIMLILQQYFDGLYEADIEKLKSIFHEDVVLKAPGFRRNRDEWLEAVATRPVPKDDNFEYAFNILSIEIINDQAMAKVNAPLPAGHYVDYLGLLKEDGKWSIVNKMFTAI
jgi:4-oxalocrotonate tautomerase